MREAYAELNREYWHNRLPKCRFYVMDLTADNWYGFHTLQKDSIHRITLDTKNNWSRVKIYNVMAHEMIHAAQCLAKSERTKKEIHGRFFQYHHIRIFGFKYKVGCY